MAHSHDHDNGRRHHHHGEHERTYSRDPAAHNARMQSDDAYRAGAVAQVEHDLDYYQVRVTALLNVLREKGILTTDEMRRAVEEIYGQSPAIGSRIVARAWVDEGFKERLLADADAACAEMGVDTSGINRVVALENTESLRYMVVCTLCSCYPRQLLGQPPTWYKSFPYRSKAVTDPRGTLRDMGLEPPEDVELVVIDSNADCRGCRCRAAGRARRARRTPCRSDAGSSRPPASLRAPTACRRNRRGIRRRPAGG